MYYNDISAVSKAAENKACVCNNQPGKFFIKSVMAGFYIVVAIILSHATSAVLYPTYPQFAKVLGALLFSIAIVLIVFIGGELFTGNNLTMAIGFYNKTCKASDVLKVWLVSYVGNFVGAFLLSAMFVASGASRKIMTDYYQSFIFDKLSASPVELLLRGILCNFLVCLAVWTGTRMKSESGKLIVMFCIIMTFVVSGLEHCIANMGIFSIGYMLLGGLDLGLVFLNLLFVTIGNIIGGAILLGLPLKLMSTEK